jgi:hypothetical protein
MIDQVFDPAIALVVFRVASFFCMTLLVYVAQQTEFDPVNSCDPRWLRWVRRGLFYIAALASGAQALVPSIWTLVVQLVAADFMLLINAVSLHLRAPRDPGSHARSSRQPNANPPHRPSLASQPATFADRSDSSQR